MRGWPWLLLSISTLLWGQPKRAITPEDIVDIRQVSDAQISPDGKRVAFVITEAGDPNKPDNGRNENIWIVPADGSEPPRRFASSPKSDTSPRWSPNGRWLAFLSDRDDGQKQIWLTRAEGGRLQKLTNAKAGVDAFKWSRDSRVIAFLARDGLTEEAQKKKDLRDDASQVDLDYKFTRLLVVELEGGNPRTVTRRDEDVADFDWSPDGGSFAVVYTQGPSGRATSGRIRILRRWDGALVRELHTNAYPDPWLVRWSPDGRNVLFLENSPRKSASWMSIVPAAGGPARAVAKDFAGTVRTCLWAPDSKQLMVAALAGTRGELLKVDSVKGEMSPVAEVLAADPAFTASADFRTVAYLSEAADSPPDVWVKESDAEPRRLTHSNPQLEALELGSVTEVSWTNRKDGLKLNGVLVTPHGFQAGKPYPMVVEAHQGDQGWWAGWQGSWWQWAQLLSSHGYVVFLPNCRGVTGQGWQLHDTIADWGGAALDDILDGVDELIARKIADPDRLGIGGWSNGGFMSAWAITHTTRFKAAVMHAPQIDSSLTWAAGAIGDWLSQVFAGTPLTAREVFEAHSPLNFVRNCRTPALLLHGEIDEDIPIAGSYEFYRSLKSMGVETSMVVYPREGHEILERAHQLDLLRRMQAWFDQHLK